MKTCATALAIVLGFAVHSSAAEFNYTFQPRLVGIGEVPDGPFPASIAKVGDLILTTHSQAGLIVCDVSDPAAPAVLSTDSRVAPGRIGPGTEYAYVAFSQVQIVDLRDPLNLVLWPNYATTDARDVAVSGDRLIVADGSGGFRVASLDNPRLPATLATFPMGGADRVVVSGGLAYGLNYNELLIIDPHTSPPVIRGSYLSPYTAAELFAVGDLVYLGVGEGPEFAYEARVEVVNVSNPASPVQVADLPLDTGISTAPPVWSLWGNAEGSWITASSGPANEFWMYTIDSPTSATKTTSLGYTVRNFVREGDDVYGATTGLTPGGCASAIAVFDVSTPEFVRPLGTLAGVDATDLTVEGSRGYLINGNDVDVVDLTDPTAPALVGSYTATGPVQEVAAGGDVICVASDSPTDVTLVDVSDPLAPVVIWGPTPMANSYLAADGAMFAVTSSSKLTLLDCSDVGSVQTDELSLSFAPSDVAIGGGVAYALEWLPGRLQAASATVPIVPYYETPLAWSPLQVEVADGQLGVSYGLVSPEPYVEIYDVDPGPGIPAAPTLRSRIDFCSPEVEDFLLHDGFLYALADRPGLEIWDLADPGNPAYVAYRPSDGEDVEVGAGFLALGEAGLTVLPLHSFQPVAAPVVAGLGAGSLRALPNPGRFGGETAVTFSTRRAGLVDLRVFDVRGRNVARLARGSYPAGDHRVTWPQDLGPGVYFVRLETPSGRESAKVVQIR